MALRHFLQRHRDGLAILALAAVVLLLAAIASWRTPPPAPLETGLLNVPLGVEQAAIVTYSGPTVAVAPYKWGVAVNVRIAAISEQAGARVYDVRYIVNRAGTFDLKDYLVSANGEALAGLPSFQFTGDPRLSKNLDTRIQETEEVTVDIGGHYYAVLGGLGAFWIVWLLLLLFWRRPRLASEVDLGPAGPTLPELVRGYLAQLEAGTLDAAAQARLEMLLLRHWRQQLALDGQSMYHSLKGIRQGAQTGEALSQLQRWLHDPHAHLAPAEVVKSLAPSVAEPLPASA